MYFLAEMTLSQDNNLEKNQKCIPSIIRTILLIKDLRKQGKKEANLLNLTSSRNPNDKLNK